LKDLEKEGIISAKVLNCPLHQGNSGIGSYDYIRPSATETRGIIAWDRSPHRAVGNTIVGRNVLYADLSVRYLTEDEFRKAPKASSASVKTPPHNVTSAAPSRPSNTPQPVIPPRPPVEEPMTITRALESLKSPGTDRRGSLRFLAETTVEAERRDDVMSAVSPLLKDVEWADAAFQVFIHWADKEQVPELIEFVRVAPTSARSKQSMKVLSRLGDARAAEPLAACLTEFHVARDAKAALAALGDIAKPAVLPLYHHENRGVQEAARELLRGYNATEDEIKSESLKAFTNSSAGTRRSAVDFFSKATLTEMQRVAVAKAMRPLIADPDKGVADATRRAMKTLATKADADYLLEQMNSSDDAVRLFATDLLVDLKDVRVAKPLAALLQDKGQTYHAGNTLIRLGSSAESAVIPLLTSEDPATRKRAAEVLAKIGTNASLIPLQRATKDKDFFARVAADHALSAIKARAADANRR
jgi:HEAT repeat protein